MHIFLITITAALKVNCPAFLLLKNLLPRISHAQCTPRPLTHLHATRKQNTHEHIRRYTYSRKSYSCQYVRYKRSSSVKFNFVFISHFPLCHFDIMPTAQICCVRRALHKKQAVIVTQKYTHAHTHININLDADVINSNNNNAENSKNNNNNKYQTIRKRSYGSK